MRHLLAQLLTLYRVLWTRVLWTYPPRELLRRLWAVLSLRRARTFVAPAPEAATTRSREERRAPLGAAGAIPVAHACPAGRKAAWSAVRAEGCADFVVHTAPRLVGSGHRCDLTRCAHCGASIERRRPSTLRTIGCTASLAADGWAWWMLEITRSSAEVRPAVLAAAPASLACRRRRRHRAGGTGTTVVVGGERVSDSSAAIESAARRTRRRRAAPRCSR